MILVEQNEDVYEIRFTYDPVVVSMVKEVPGRTWHPDDKYWSIPKSRLGFLIAQFKGTKYESQLAIKSDEDINVNASINDENPIPDIDISDMHLYVQDGFQVFNHQKDMLKYAKWRYENGLKSGFILADEPGCIGSKCLIKVKLDYSDAQLEIPLIEVYELFKEGHHIEVRSLCNGIFKYFNVDDILDKGEREVIRIQTDTIELTCTPDHLVLTDRGWIEAGQLQTDDNIYYASERTDETIKFVNCSDISTKDSSGTSLTTDTNVQLNTSPICKISDYGKDNVYDIVIDHPEIHNFTANDIVVHNCGKTLQVMEWAMYLKEKYGAKHCLIIACVNSAKYNWQEDIKKHTNGLEVPYIVGTRKKRDGTFNFSTGSKEKLEDLTAMKMYGGKTDEDLPYFLVLNIEAIRMREGKKYPIADRVIELLNNGEIPLVALDEVHLGLGAQSLQGKQMLRIKKNVKADVQWIPMTGTPITSKPTDVFLPLRLVDGHQNNSSWSWNQKYCVYGGFGGHEIIAYQNIPHLKSILQPNMLRRLKKNILDLPPKIHYTEYIENSAYQQKLYKKIELDLVTERDSVVKSLNPLSQFLHLRQVNGSPELVDDSVNPNAKDYLSKNAKLARLLELLDDILAEPSEKVVIFSNWVEPLRTLYKYISKKYKICCYTGTMASDKREKHKQAFMNDPDRRVMIGTVGALGTSHTLTVARNVIFYDSPWNPADIEQAEDRCHRPGTTDSVFVYSLIVKGTVDEKVHEILSKKEGTANFIVDNELDLHSHPELFDLLLSH